MSRLVLMRPRALWILLISAMTVSATAGGQDADRTADRATFLRAERALKSGDRPTFETLRDQLRDYPLYPYLRFAELGDQQAAPDAAIETFLAEFPDTPLAERLRAAYVKRLAQAGRWADLARIYREEDDSVERRCLYLRALIETGATDRALDPARLELLWLKPSSQPAACDPLFEAWRAQGGLTSERLWARIRLALEAGEKGLARQLGTWLPASERPWLDYGLAVLARPARVLEPLPEPARADGQASTPPSARANALNRTPPSAPTGAIPVPPPLAAAILAVGIVNLARTAPEQAALALATHADTLERDPLAWDRAHAAVGQALTPVDGPRGLALWDRMAVHDENLEAQERRLRAAIGQRDWGRVAEWVRRMPDQMEKRDRWLYWQGRAEAALGQDEAAQASFAAAARQRSLWGLLAADRLGLPYPLASRPVPVEPEPLRRLATAPALERIRELQRLGRDADMRREWRTLTRDLKAPDLRAAATLAAGLGWHDQAIFTLARTDYWDDLELRFPLAYRGLVEEQAWQTGLPEDWIYGVIRQESVFNPTVASQAGALGLMQLMPGTAQELAVANGEPAPGRGAILEPERNINLGSTYLARMRDRFGHPALATAAYNAGPNRVARWLPEACTETDLWIVAIPYAETRGYVERVLAYRIIYRARLGLEPQRLSELLPPIPGG
jgi:soluble lytic murein transglycosylase